MNKQNQQHNLFIVRSPLQFINAIEAKHHFKTQNNILCLIHNTSSINSIQMHKLLPIENWDEVLEHNIDNKKNNLLSNIKFIKKLYNKSYDYLFSGNLGNINIAIISSIKKEKFFLIDDGTSTLTLHKGLLNPKIQKKKTLNSFIREYRYRVFGLQCNLRNETINYFTLFDIFPYRNEKIIKNTFSFLKDKFENTTVQQEKTIYFLGQNLVEIGSIKEEIYIYYLKKIIKYYEGQKIIYYPHRSEEITSAYNSLKYENFIIKNTEQAIEIELLTKGINPFTVASFISSALFTLHQIFPNTNIDSFILKTEDLLSHQDVIHMLYENQDEIIHQVNL